MQRRTFIRLVGGGTLASAAAATGLTVALGGWSTDYPAPAVQAWNGPPADADLRRRALGYAILAPNSHNLQPWLVDLSEPNAITLYVDRQRLLPMTDPWYRQIMVSQGTFLEALVLALQAQGVQPQVHLFPQGAFAPREVDDRPVARVHWAASPAAALPQPDPLFAQILRRRTAKVDYDTTRPVSPQVLQAVLSVVDDPQVRVRGTVDPAQLPPLRQLCWDAAIVELTTPRTVMESVRLTRVGPREIARHRDGISLNGLMPRVADLAGAFDRENPPTPDSPAMRTMMNRFQGHSFTAMGFTWLSTPVEPGRTRHAEVAAGRAYMRQHLKATELGLQMHPMSQAPQEFEEMRPHHERLHALLLQRPAGEEVVQMFSRIGYSAAAPATPRRGVDAIIRA